MARKNKEGLAGVPDTADLKNELTYFLLVILVLITLGSLAATLYYYLKMKDTDTAYNFLIVTMVIGLFTFIYYGILKFIASLKLRNKDS